MKNILIAVALAGALSAAAFAQTAAPARVRGTIGSLDGNVLTVNTAAGAPTKIVLAPDFKVTYIVKSSLDKIAPGSYIGTAAEPQADGTLKALEIQIFPPGFTPGPGSRPYDLTPTSTMTNGHVENVAATKVDKSDANIFTVTYEGGEKKVVVTPGTIAIEYVPADASALKPGAHVIVIVSKKDDGTLTAAGVNVGKDGLTPPM
jgi:hypothetical protein